MRKGPTCMLSIPTLDAALHLVLQDAATEYGVRTGWHQRRSPLSPAQFVQTLVFGWLADPHASLGRLARMAATVGAPITPQALSQRFTPAAVALLRGVLQDALGVLLQADAVVLPAMAHFPGGVYIQDSTQIAWHPDWMAVWVGAGTDAALKVQVAWDLLTGALASGEVLAAQVADTSTATANGPFPSGSVVIEDLGYLDGERMQVRHQQGVGTIIPLKAGLHVLTPSGQRLDVVAWVHAQPQAVQERLVLVHGHPYRLIAVPVSPEAAARKRAGLIAGASRAQQALPAQPYALAAWIVILTTVPPEQASAPQIAALLRARWQIELLFKLWKDQGQLDATRGWQPDRILTEWYAKLLGLLILHWGLLVTSWHLPERSLVKAAQAIREAAQLLAFAWHHPAYWPQVWQDLITHVTKTGRLSWAASKQATYHWLLAP